MRIICAFRRPRKAYARLRTEINDYRSLSISGIDKVIVIGSAEA